MDNSRKAGFMRACLSKIKTVRFPGVFAVLFFFISSLLSGCAAASSSGPLCVCCTESSKEWMKEKLEAYREQHPDFTYRLEVVPPWVVGEMTQEQEEAALQFRTEVLAGRGPDLFWMSPGGAYLFPDPQKSMESGVFCNLADLNDRYGGFDFSETAPVLCQAGQWEGKQYILPTGWGPMGTVRYGEKVRLSIPESLEEYQKISGYAFTIASNGFSRAPACLIAGGEDAFGPLLERYTCQVAHYAYPEQAAKAIDASGFLKNMSTTSTDPIPIEFRLLEEKPFFRHKNGEPYLPHLLLLPCEGGGPCAVMTHWAGIRANSAYKQEAWELLCFLMEPIKENFDLSLGLPIYPDKIEIVLEQFERQINQGELFFSAAERGALAGCLQEALARCNYALYYSDVLRLGQEYNECFGPYFAGTQTLEECAGRWRTRLEIYGEE